MAVPVLWRTQKQRYNLQAAVCPHCAEAIFPPRAVCPVCLHSMKADATVASQQAAPVASTRTREFIYTVPAVTATYAGKLHTATAMTAAGDD